MRKKLWFGMPGKKLQWVPEPLMSSGVSNIGYSESITFENGGSDARSSKAKHRVYTLAFSDEVAGPEGLRAVEKFASGYYGEDYIHFSDPYNFTTNLLPPHWATPALVREGWPKISPVDVTFIQSPKNDYDQPTVSVIYEFDGQEEFSAGSPYWATIVIPPTHNLHLGVSGQTQGSGVMVYGQIVDTITNRIIDPSFENEIPSSATTSECDASLSTDWASTGVSSLLLSPDSADNNSFYAPAGNAGVVFNMELDATYTVKAKIHLDDAQTGTLHPNARRIVAVTKVGSDPAVEIKSDQAPNEAGDTELTLSFTVPDGASEAFIILYNGASQGNGDVYWDDLLLVEGDYFGEYFDGNNGINTSWNGDENDSTSTTNVIYRRIDMLDPVGAIRMNTVISGEEWDHVRIFMNRESKVDSGTVEVTSMMAQLHPIGRTPNLTGNHVHGDGNTGMIFVGEARDEDYVYIDPPRKFTSYTLQEVEAWR
jgi:hypothetical protein